MDELFRFQAYVICILPTPLFLSIGFSIIIKFGFTQLEQHPGVIVPFAYANNDVNPWLLPCNPILNSTSKFLEANVNPY